MATITIEYDEYLALLRLRDEIKKLENEKVQLTEDKGVLVKHVIQKREEDMGLFEYDGASYYEQIPKDELYERLAKNFDELRASTTKEVKRLKSRNLLQRILNR